MKKVKLALALVLILVLAVVAVQNRAPLQIRFFWMSGEVPGVILLFLTAAAGFALGLVASYFVRREGRPVDSGGKQEEAD